MKKNGLRVLLCATMAAVTIGTVMLSQWQRESRLGDVLAEQNEGWMTATCAEVRVYEEGPLGTDHYPMGREWVFADRLRDMVVRPCHHRARHTRPLAALTYQVPGAMDLLVVLYDGAVEFLTSDGSFDRTYHIAAGEKEMWAELDQLVAQDQRPEEVKKQSTVMEHTAAYSYEAPAGTTPEEGALACARLFLEGLRQPAEERTFQIERYQDLGVTVMPTTTMDAETANIYFLQPEEISETTWVVEVEALFQFSGSLSPYGPWPGVWVEDLHQGSPVGFLLRQEGNTFTLQSRYEAANGR